MQTHVVIIGAGPAGLTAAYLLAKQSIPVIVLEANSTEVGGLAKTINYNDYRFDIGGHCLFTQSAEVKALWREILPEDILDCPRSSSIVFQRKFFSSPLKVIESLQQLGVIESALCILSYLKAKLFPNKKANSFSAWASNQFGKRWASIFFKSYAKKVWGMHYEQLSADWALQQMKGLYSLDNFQYPRKGPGMLWQACADKIKALGGKILMGSEVFRCDYQPSTKVWTIFYRDSQG